MTMFAFEFWNSLCDVWSCNSNIVFSVPVPLVAYKNWGKLWKLLQKLAHSFIPPSLLPSHSCLVIQMFPVFPRGTPLPPYYTAPGQPEQQDAISRQPKGTDGAGLGFVLWERSPSLTELCLMCLAPSMLWLPLMLQLPLMLWSLLTPLAMLLMQCSHIQSTLFLPWSNPLLQQPTKGRRQQQQSKSMGQLRLSYLLALTVLGWLWQSFLISQLMSLTLVLLSGTSWGQQILPTILFGMPRHFPSLPNGSTVGQHWRPPRMPIS